MGNLLEVQNLSFSYGDNHVLKEIELSIPENELVSILGINGAGKSTLIKCLNRIITPQTAEIKIQSMDLNELDLVEISKLITLKQENGLDLDSSICSDFEKNTKSKNISLLRSMS